MAMLRRPPVFRRRRQSSTISQTSSETAWPIKDKLHMENPYEGGTKVYINGPGHMTKMATLAINSKNLYKSYSSQPEDL